MANRDGTLVLDIGKSRAKLLLVDGAGSERWRDECANASQLVPGDGDDAPGYLALGVDRLMDWIDGALSRLGQELAGARPPCPPPRRLIVATHGAAFCALGEHGLLLPPIDYEWDGYGDVTAGFEASLANFGHHGTPALPQGLNAGRQLDWLQRRHAKRLQGLRCWLPYPQYWSWWLCGVAASEVSSLGCHTGLWAPADGRFSDWARASGIADRFAPLSPASEPLGRLRPALARRWGLPEDMQVMTGAHDSNACLARHLRAHPDAIVVSTGTWTVVMAPGASTQRLRPEMDELVNVAVDGRAVPTARFMGGREFAALCDGADPLLATDAALSEVLADGWSALPSWAGTGGPFAGLRGRVLRNGQPDPAGPQAVPVRLRPALASLYCARMSGLLIDDLQGDDHGVRAPVIVEGPLAHNQAYCTALAAHLRGRRELLCCADDIEGTARGAWLLAKAADSVALSPLAPAGPIDAALRQALDEDARRWYHLIASSTR